MHKHWNVMQKEQLHTKKSIDWLTSCIGLVLLSKSKLRTAHIYLRQKVRMRRSPRDRWTDWIPVLQTGLGHCWTFRTSPLLCFTLQLPLHRKAKLRATCGAVRALLFTPNRHQAVILPFGFSAAWRNKWILSASNRAVTLSSTENFVLW